MDSTHRQITMIMNYFAVVLPNSIKEMVSITLMNYVSMLSTICRTSLIYAHKIFAPLTNCLFFFLSVFENKIIQVENAASAEMPTIYQFPDRTSMAENMDKE